MRKILLAATLAFAAAYTPVAAQNSTHETIEGNGKLVTRTVAVQSFDALKASGVYELQLTQGPAESVKIEADENLQDYFTVHNEGSKLVIDMKKLENKNLNGKNKMKVYVTFKNLKNLELSMVGNVKGPEPLTFNDLEVLNKSVGNIDLKMTANKLDLDNKSVGNITLSGKAQNAVMRNNGVGNIKAGDFLVQTIDIENSGVGNAEVNAEKELKVKDNWLGKVRNKGAATARKMNKVVI